MQFCSTPEIPVTSSIEAGVNPSRNRDPTRGEYSCHSPSRLRNISNTSSIGILRYLAGRCEEGGALYGWYTCPGGAAGGGVNGSFEA